MTSPTCSSNKSPFSGSTQHYTGHIASQHRVFILWIENFGPDVSIHPHTT